MMYVFPVITTPNISKNILVAICRTLEHYLIVYHTDEVLQRISSKSGDELDVRQKKLVNVTHEQKGPAVNREPDVTISIPELKKAPSKEIKLDLPQRDAMTLEPTYVKIDHPKLGTQILAIKAIPFKVKNPEMMLSLLQDDYSSYYVVKLLRQFERGVVRLIWRLIKGFIPFSAIRNRAISGDFEQDIIYGLSKSGKDVFVLFDKNEVTKNLEDNAPKVKKLFSMYWPSFVIVDEVEKAASFCMEGFNGQCSVVHYPYLLASIGTSQKQVYDDLEEVRKSSSQFFRLSSNKNKVLECSCFSEKDKQLNELTRGGREVLIEDDVLPIVNKLTDPAKIEKLFSKLKLSLQTKEDQVAIKALENIPVLSIQSIEKFAKKGSPHFLSSYEKIETVLTNSTKIPSDLVKPISLMLAIDSTYKISNAKQATKENLLTFVPLIRKLKIIQFPVRTCVKIFSETLADSDKAGLAAGILLLKICLNSIPTNTTKEETDDGSEV